jgi:carboxyl-terminal processing protease
VTLAEGTALREQPSAESRALALVRGGLLSVTAEAEAGGFLRVRSTRSQRSQQAGTAAAGQEPAQEAVGVVGWVPAAAVTQERPTRQGTLESALNRMPPALEVVTPELVTTSSSIRIRGVARDESLVRDLYIYAGPRKVFYHSNRGGQDPREASFDTTIPLGPGINFIVVIARENDQSFTRHGFVVRRDGPDGALLTTPRHADEWFQFGVGEEE